MESQEFLEDIRMAGAPGQEGFDQVNAGLIADHYGHSKEFILSLIRHERKAQLSLKEAENAIKEKAQ